MHTERKPRKDRMSLTSYQALLDKKYGRSKVIAHEYITARATVPHSVGKTLFDMHPDRMLRYYGSYQHLTEHIVGDILTRRSAEKFPSFVKAAGKGFIQCSHQYLGTRKTHTFSCNRCDRHFQKMVTSLTMKDLLCPTCDYSPKYSAISLRWLADMSSRYRIRIRNARSTDGEKQLLVDGAVYRVDGFSDKYSVVFEFHGDCFHGNPNIYKLTDRPNPYSSKTARVLRSATIKRESAIHSAGFTVISIWESDYKSEKQYTSWLRECDKKMTKVFSDGTM
jgi:hypothetical protein